MDRRRAIGVAITVAFAIAGGVSAQPVGKRRIGFMSPVDPATIEPFLRAFRDELKAQGFVDKKNLELAARWPGKNQTLQECANELIREHAEVIVAWGTPSTLAAKEVTKSVPIVMLGIGDPIGAGLVENLARPGANVTGVAALHRDIIGKLLQIFSGLLPRSPLIAILHNPKNPAAVLQLRETLSAGASLGIKLRPFEATTLEALETVFPQMTAAGAAGVVVISDQLFVGQRARLAEFAIQNRLPSAFVQRDNVKAGGLLSYGTSLPEQFRLAGQYAAKILHGARPPDLPVQQPTRLALAINLRTAKMLRLDIPANLLSRADEVID